MSRKIRRLFLGTCNRHRSLFKAWKGEKEAFLRQRADFSRKFRNMTIWIRSKVYIRDYAMRYGDYRSQERGA